MNQDGAGAGIVRRRLAGAACFGFIIAYLGGCATRVENTSPSLPVAASAQRLPRPTEVLVYDFAVDWQTVQLDQGLRARLLRQGGEPDQDQQRVAAEVQDAIAETLVEQIRAMGLLATRAGPATPSRPGDVLVRGQIVRVDAGNATRRNLIGFGAGKSEVFADAQLVQDEPGQPPRTLQTYDASANSGRTPGLGIGAASAAAGNVGLAIAGSAAGTAARARSGLPHDGENLAKRVARNLAQFFAGQGWIDPGAIPGLLG